jgi:hypothetical protein
VLWAEAARGSRSCCTRHSRTVHSCVAIDPSNLNSVHPCMIDPPALPSPLTSRQLHHFKLLLYSCTGTLSQQPPSSCTAASPAGPWTNVALTMLVAMTCTQLTAGCGWRSIHQYIRSPSRIVLVCKGLPLCWPGHLTYLRSCAPKCYTFYTLVATIRRQQCSALGRTLIQGCW